MSIAAGRLAEERRSWRRDHPPEFSAKPVVLPDGATNLMRWTASVPGKAGTDWEGGAYKVDLIFPADYPVHPPKVRFSPVIFHPNVYADGEVCLSIINPDDGWAPSVTIPQILLGLQSLLTEPNPASPANGEAAGLLCRDPKKYRARVRAQAAKHVPDHS